MTQARIELIKTRLNEVLQATQVEVIDDSHLHEGHASAGGAGHFRVTVVSDQFQDKKMLERHRLVYQALDDIMNTEIHALSIKAYTDAELASAS
ncbi:MAG: BolA family transcriptional regulator [Gammaproteobacteria bacterium]|nr:BolA family transcriptional regulator [Gammaproteobacteria bacterium]MDH5729952.1 BolA family transcriptional regulator [Gammaproteobacteria bacterium]